MNPYPFDPLFQKVFLTAICLHLAFIGILLIPSPTPPPFVPIKVRQVAFVSDRADPSKSSQSTVFVPITTQEKTSSKKIETKPAIKPESPKKTEIKQNGPTLSVSPPIKEVKPKEKKALSIKDPKKQTEKKAPPKEKKPVEEAAPSGTKKDPPQGKSPKKTTEKQDSSPLENKEKNLIAQNTSPLKKENNDPSISPSSLKGSTSGSEPNSVNKEQLYLQEIQEQMIDQLEPPEEGTAKIRLVIGRQGEVLNVEIIECQNPANRAYLEQALRLLFLSPLYLSSPHLTHYTTPRFFLRLTPSEK